MSPLTSLIVLIIIVVTSMSVVAYANYKVDQARNVRSRLQKHKIRVEELEDMVLALDQLCENRTIPKLINDEVIELYENMIELDKRAAYLKAGHTNAKMRSEELSDESTGRHITRLCNSDAQIARLQAYLDEACVIIRKQHSQGNISSSAMQTIILELEWLYLMVNVISNIAQGHKAYNRHDIISAKAFYKKAQTELIRSGHPDERRQQMIKQLADVIVGRRKSIDSSLMPEAEFNPENHGSVLSEEDQQTPMNMMEEDGMNETQIDELTQAMIIQKKTGKSPGYKPKHH